MNRSGECIRKLVDFYKLDVSYQLLVISDDIDLPLGEVRLRMNGGPGTHNGLRSIVETIGEGFPRLRIGIGTPSAGEDLAAWVLSSLSPAEDKALTETLRGIPERLKTFVMESPQES
jgi:PTH1 family peptidyl-tRNA hydrolase